MSDSGINSDIKLSSEVQKLNPLVPKQGFANRSISQNRDHLKNTNNLRWDKELILGAMEQ